MSRFLQLVGPLSPHLADFCHSKERMNETINATLDAEDAIVVRLINDLPSVRDLVHEAVTREGGREMKDDYITMAHLKTVIYHLKNEQAITGDKKTLLNRVHNMLVKPVCG